jgi:sn-glycerol 3-phosphate transport system permease protein
VSGLRSRPRRRRRGEAPLAYALIAPTVAILAVFAVYPAYRLFRMALYRPNRFGTGERYVGWGNISEVLTGEQFLDGCWITLRLMVMTVPAGVVLGILLALAAHRPIRGIKFFQTVFSSTVASSAALAAVVFFGLLNNEVGAFRDVGALSLADGDTALRGIAVTMIWQNIGVTFIVVLAGLQSVPDEILEAARLDGFGPWRRTTQIVLPLISPALLFLSVVLMTTAFQAFAQVELLTGGGPAASTETIVFKIFQRQSPGLVSEGAAMSIGLFVLTFVVALIQIGSMNRRIHYGD